MDRDYTNLKRVRLLSNFENFDKFEKVYLSIGISVLIMLPRSESLRLRDLRNSIPAEPAPWWEPTPEPESPSALCPAAAR